jgi:hypothetical protein
VRQSVGEVLEKCLVFVIPSEGRDLQLLKSLEEMQIPRRSGPSK